MEITLLIGLLILFFWSFFLPKTKAPPEPKDAKKEAEKLLIQLRADQQRKQADMNELQTLLDRGHFDPP